MGDPVMLKTNAARAGETNQMKEAGRSHKPAVGELN